jgi:hypothetical protein
MKGLESATFDWQRRIELLDIDKLNVSYSVGKVMDQNRDMILKNLRLIREVIQRQSVQNKLSRDVILLNSLHDVLASFDAIFDLLPENQEAERWGHEFPNIKEFGSFQLPLERHILDYSDELQEKAEKCSR